MTISFNVKSGTGGYRDYDNCDLCILTTTTEDFPIPRVGEFVDILENNDDGNKNSKGEILKEFHQYQVTEVRYWISDDSNKGVNVYVIPIGRSVK